MRKIRKIKIEGFWGDKTVDLNFDKEVNFLIGVNGSGKTTIINLIAASLNADFATLDKSQFKNIRLDFHETDSEKKGKFETYIEVEKVAKENSPYSNIILKIKLPDEVKVKSFLLNELEEDSLFRMHDYERIIRIFPGQTRKDVASALKAVVNVTWLSIHRISSPNKNNDDKSFESTIDQKIKELSIDLTKYFGVLDRTYSIETEKFQKNIFLSLIQHAKGENAVDTDDLESEKEKDSLRQIFLLFKLKESEFSEKLDKHFANFEKAKDEWARNRVLATEQLVHILATRRIHSIVQEWNRLNEKKININKIKVTFLDEINNLFERKRLFINDRNELLVETQSGKVFPLVHLSSGEKQLLIILGQGLMQENRTHIYIADEPELSLHVEWQEKLVSCLKNVNPNSQIIFATHSPDIVGKFTNSIIKVESAIA
ncbi:MAG: AAA family ATPase [Chitinophagales bacterium]|nr:AAA family ATPase [Chitinophagales bacterium]